MRPLNLTTQVTLCFAPLLSKYYSVKKFDYLVVTPLSRRFEILCLITGSRSSILPLFLCSKSMSPLFGTSTSVEFR